MTLEAPDKSPDEWDLLSAVDRDSAEAADIAPDEDPPAPRGVNRATRVAAAWADGVVVAAVTTLLVAAVVAARYPVAAVGLPWAAGTGAVLWLAMGTILVRIRRGTPGMLIAGFVFTDQVAGVRLLLVLCAAAVDAALLGLPSLCSGRRTSLLTVAAATGVSVVE